MSLRRFLLVLVLLTACACSRRRDHLPTPPAPTPPPAPALTEDIVALHDQDLSFAVPSCQTTGCHEDQMERYAPHQDVLGNDIENFHYTKARTLSGTYFGGRSPRELTDKDCTVCHKRVKILTRSAANGDDSQTYLRRMVDVSFCAGCHGANTSKPFYLK